MNLLIRTINMENLQRKIITVRKDRMKENELALVEEIRRQQELVNEEGSMVKHRCSFKKKEEETLVNRRRIPSKKSKDKQYGIENKNAERLPIMDRVPFYLFPM